MTTKQIFFISFILLFSHALFADETKHFSLGGSVSQIGIGLKGFDNDTNRDSLFGSSLHLGYYLHDWVGIEFRYVRADSNFDLTFWGGEESLEAEFEAADVALNFTAYPASKFFIRGRIGLRHINLDAQTVQTDEERQSTASETDWVESSYKSLTYGGQVLFVGAEIGLSIGRKREIGVAYETMDHDLFDSSSLNLVFKHRF